MSELLEILSEAWAIRALITTSLVGITCGIIGCFIVLRNMSMIGDALSHAILPGIFAAFVFVGYSVIGFFIGSVFAGIITAVLITWIQRHVRTKNDAAIGIAFTFMFALGVIGISWLNNEQGAHLDLKDFLFGNVLGISNEDIIITAMVAGYTILSIVIFYRYFFITTFQPTIAQTMGISVLTIHYFLMLLLSFAVVAALRAVGVILVVAMLITPAATALLLSEQLKKVIAISALIGMLASVMGMVISIIFSWPPGPAMVVVATFIYLLVAVFSPKRGLVTQYLKNERNADKIIREDILRFAIKRTDTPIHEAELLNFLGVSSNKLQQQLAWLKNKGLIKRQPEIALTEDGVLAANKLVRAHRLWESYQVETMGLDAEQIHSEADYLEHHLSEELLNEVDKKLGYPSTDPHGSPIPEKSDMYSLLFQEPDVKLRVSRGQWNDKVESDLWELGLMPNTIITIRARENDTITVDHEGERISIPIDLARHILVTEDVD